MNRPIEYQERLPPIELRDVVSAFWSLDVCGPLPADFVHHVWPDGSISIAVISVNRGLVAASLVGPSTESFHFPLIANASYRGVRFWPHAGAAFLNLDVASIRNRSLPVSDVFDTTALGNVIAIVEATSYTDVDIAFTRWLDSLRPQSGAIDQLVRSVVLLMMELDNPPSIASIATSLGTSTRQLQRRMQSAVGLTPKELARVCRGRGVIGSALNRETRWSDVAATHGFADQPHLTHDLGALTGLTPQALRAYLDLIEHRLLAQ